jgi:hypothetical protein
MFAYILVLTNLYSNPRPNNALLRTIGAASKFTFEPLFTANKPAPLEGCVQNEPGVALKLSVSLN